MGNPYDTDDPWSIGGILPSNQYNSSEAVKADQRSMAMQLQAQGFNSSEAQKQRDFEKSMSDTSYQRAAADLKAAGYSPLALLGSGGASTPSGSAAHSNSATSHGAASEHVGSSIASGLISLIGGVISSGMSTATKLAVAAASNASSEAISNNRLANARSLLATKIASSSALNAARTRDANSSSALKDTQAALKNLYLGELFKRSSDDSKLFEPLKDFFKV